MKQKIIYAVLIAVLIIGIILGRKAQTTQKASPPHPGEMSNYTLENCLSMLDEENVRESSKGSVHWFVPKSLSHGLNLKMSQVPAMEARHRPHKHTGEEIFYILEGRAEFTLGDEQKVVGPNSALYCPPNISHGIRNAGDTPMRYLVIRVD